MSTSFTHQAAIPFNRLFFDLVPHVLRASQPLHAPHQPPTSSASCAPERVLGLLMVQIIPNLCESILCLGYNKLNQFSFSFVGSILFLLMFSDVSLLLLCHCHCCMPVALFKLMFSFEDRDVDGVGSGRGGSGMSSLGGGGDPTDWDPRGFYHE